MAKPLDIRHRIPPDDVSMNLDLAFLAHCACALEDAMDSGSDSRAARKIESFLLPIS